MKPFKLVSLSFSSSWEEGIDDGIGLFDCAWFCWVGLDLSPLSLLKCFAKIEISNNSTNIDKHTH